VGSHGQERETAESPHADGVIRRRLDDEPLQVAEADELAGDAEELSIGCVLGGKYRVLQELGRGGMGTVYRAHHEALDAEVAVKVIRPSLERPRDPELAARLLQEARAAAQLGHPAIMRVFDLGWSSTGHPYLVMELLEGEDLASAIDQQGALEPVPAVQLILPIVDALATAHERGIVHRDVKPANIFLARTEGGGLQPKLIDFGVARLERGTGTRLTAAGTPIGSPDYMSPEQARGLDAGYASDIWSLCVVIYEMVVGHTPFAASNYNSLMRTIIEDPHVPLLKLGLDDEQLSTIVDRGLAKAAHERWPSMRELGRALACWLLSRHCTEDVCHTSLRRSWLAARSAEQPRGQSVPFALMASAPRPEPPPPDVAGLRRPRALTLALGAASVLLLGGGAHWRSSSGSSHDTDARVAASAPVSASTSEVSAPLLPTPASAEPPQGAFGMQAECAGGDASAQLPGTAQARAPVTPVDARRLPPLKTPKF
jgi:serine/threonine-protein kinase